MGSKAGSIVHMELYAKDVEQSADFYRDIFGWKVIPTDAGFAMWEDTAGTTGGFVTQGEPVFNTTASLYIEVEDIDESLGRISAKGGEVVQPKTEIGADFGFYALFKDPAGNILGVHCDK